MSDIYITSGEYEECMPDKEPIKMIYPMNAIHYITCGQGFFNGSALTVNQGFICRKNRPVHYYPDHENPWTYLWFRLEGVNLDEVLEDHGLNTPPYCFHFDWMDSLIKFFELFSAENYRILKNRTHSEICANLLISYHKSSVRKNVQQSQRRIHVDTAKEYIRSNFYKRITIADVAGSLHLNRGYLRNIFFLHEGISTQEFLINQRIQRAKELLEFEDIPIFLVASSVGYSDAMQFCRLFKKHTNLSPSAYREQVTGVKSKSPE